MNRRGFLQAMLAACAAPAIVRADSLMRVKSILLPGEDFQFDWNVHGDGITVLPVGGEFRIVQQELELSEFHPGDWKRIDDFTVVLSKVTRTQFIQSLVVANYYKSQAWYLPGVT